MIISIHDYSCIHIHIQSYSYIHPPISHSMPLHQIKPICFTPLFSPANHETAKARVH